MNGLEIIVSEGALNGLSNYDELMAYSREQLKPYEGMLVTEDQLGAAKDIVARMRKVAKAASDLRIRTEREHAEKIALAVKQLKDIAATFTDAAAKIDGQVKEIANQRKAAKREELVEYFKDIVGIAAEYIEYEDIADDKWLNVSVSMDTAKDQMEEAVKSFQQDVAAIEAMVCEPAIKASVKAEFKRTKSLAAAMRLMTTLEQMAKAQKDRDEKATQAAQQETTKTLTEEPKKETPTEEVWEITFCVKGTKNQFMALKEFLVNSGMEYRKAV